jgi:hypothetical protein
VLAVRLPRVVTFWVRCRTAGGRALRPPRAAPGGRARVLATTRAQGMLMSALPDADDVRSAHCCGPGAGCCWNSAGSRRTQRQCLTVSTGVTARVIDSPVGTTLGASPGVNRVLVRPDGHVCWTGAGPDPRSPRCGAGSAPYCHNVAYRIEEFRLSTMEYFWYHG